jgi:HEAT repeat protein
MKNAKSTLLSYLAVCLVLLAVLAQPGAASSAESKASAAGKERELIAVLQSDAAPAEKAITCKRLAVYGTKNAVPALAPLLADEQLASWARIPLEVIPGPAADAALRDAMARLHGKLLIGVINSIAVRRDHGAVTGLVNKLNEPDADVASAAAVALGRIGGSKAAKALEAALGTAPEGVRSSVAQGCVLCAEGFLLAGKRSDAVKLYDTVRAANVPKQHVLEATRGAILARQSAGLPLLLEQLRSPDKALYGIGLRTARELPGQRVTEALAAELDRCGAERQGPLLLALADRTDAAVLPTVLAAAKTGSPKLRLVAVGVLDRMNNPKSLPTLIEVASAGDPELTPAAESALARLPGNEPDTQLLARLPQASGKAREVLIQVVEQRRIDKALPVLVTSAEDADPGVRHAAVQAIGTLGSGKQAADLVRLLRKTQDSKAREDIEMALIAISGRARAGCVEPLLTLGQNSDAGLKIIELHALASAGGPEALSAVKAAVQDTDETVQDEAVRTLSTWPNNWPEDSAVAEPLLALAKSGRKTSHQVLGMRGYLQYIKSDKQLSNEQKVSKISESMPLLKRPEEQRLAMAAIDGISTPGALELLSHFAAEPEMADDACAAIVSLTGKSTAGISKEQRQKALLVVMDKTTNEKTKKKAEDLLKSTQ